jgi:hypothetical protein
VKEAVVALGLMKAQECDKWIKPEEMITPECERCSEP